MEDVKTNEHVRLVTDRDRDEWLMCLQKAQLQDAASDTAEGADWLYREFRKRIVK